MKENVAFMKYNEMEGGIRMAWIILWSITLALYAIAMVSNYFANKTRSDILKVHANSNIRLCKEITKLNNRIDSYYRIKNTEIEEQE